MEIVKLTTRLPKLTRRKLNTKAKKEGHKVYTVINTLIEKYIAGEVNIK